MDHKQSQSALLDDVDALKYMWRQLTICRRECKRQNWFYTDYDLIRRLINRQIKAG